MYAYPEGTININGGEMKWTRNEWNRGKYADKF
jgi:hypothetical protein